MNFLTLFKALDAVAALAAAARGFKAAGPKVPPSPSPDVSLQGQTAPIDARLTGVVVAALKEAFNRDHARLELERAQLDEERRRAEQALNAELRRQAADRELGRLRLLAGTALIGWLASVLVLGVRAADASGLARAALAVGWMLLLGALAAAFTAQGRVGGNVGGNVAANSNVGADLQVGPCNGPSGTTAIWLLVGGLAVTAISLLL